MEITPERERRHSEGSVAIVKVDLHRTVAVMAAEKIRPAVAVEVGDGGTTVFAPPAEWPVQAGGERDVRKGECICQARET